MFLKNRNICSKIKRSKVTDYAALNYDTSISRLGMSVTTQGGSGRQYVTGPGRIISKYRFVLLNVYRFQEI